jgi:prepilin-type processing-associated H-X9-DG protein
MNLPLRNTRIPLLGGALHCHDEGFRFNGGAPTVRFDCCFMLEQELPQVRLVIILWQDGHVETMRPRRFLELSSQWHPGVFARA